MVSYTHLNYHQMFKAFMDLRKYTVRPIHGSFHGASFNFHRASHVLPGNNIWLQWINFIGLLVLLTGGKRERYGDDKGGEKSSVFVCIEIYHGFPVVLQNVGMELDEMWEMIPALKGQEFFVSVCIVPLDILTHMCCLLHLFAVYPGKGMCTDVH